MSRPEIMSHAFQEELYRVPIKPVVALPVAWSEIRESDKTLLVKILGLAKIALNHVNVLTTNKLDVLQWRARPSQVIAFGIDAPGLSQNEIIEIQDIKLIVTSSLPDLETMSKDTKQKLAGTLKQMFLPLSRLPQLPIYLLLLSLRFF